MHNLFMTPGPITVEVRNSAGDIRIALTDTASAAVDVTAVAGHQFGLLDDIFRAVGANRGYGAPNPGAESIDPADRARVELRENPAGQTLVVDTDPAREGWRSAFDIVITAPAGSSVRVQSQSADVLVTGRANRVEVRSASGSVRLTETTASALVQTASGDIHADSVGGDLDARSASGDVEVGAVAGRAQIQTTSGDIRLSSPAGDLVARSVSGDVRVLDAVTGTAELAAVSGDVEVGVHAGTLVAVSLSTISGSTDSDFDVEDAPPAESAPTLELRVKTTTGDIALRRAVAV